ncbi:MAG: malate dehydrogenase [Chlamydiales bacterium]
MKRIAITGGTGQIAYELFFRLAHGHPLGSDQPIALHIGDIPGTEQMMEGIKMELEDSAFPLLREVKYFTNPYELFEGVDIALLIGAKPRGPGMERSDLLMDNGRIFVEAGQALNKTANKEVKVIVVGNPCNTNCLIAMHHAPNLSRKNFHAMMRLDQTRAQSFLAKKANVSVGEVTRMTIWGNHSATQVPDFVNACISKRKVMDVIKDKEWLQGEFIEMIQKRGAAIIRARGKSSSGSAANALLEALRSLYTQTSEDDWFSSAVCSNGNPYGIEEDLVFGFPCRSKGKGDCEVVGGLEWDFFLKEKIAVTQQELIQERECVIDLLKG